MVNEKTILLKNIKPNDYNPNEMTEQQFEELVREVKHLGKPPKPIVLRDKGEFFEIVDGEHNYLALGKLGHQELQEGWYEIVDYDDIEAKRQTWKRNLGGTNNPVKTGLMFAEALEKSGMSNYQLAENWEISEGTIRNYLLYADAAKLRNDYANLALLSINQIRLYLKIADYSVDIANFWLSCGGFEDALVWHENKKFKEAEKNLSLFPFLKLTFTYIVEQGATRVLLYKPDFIPINLSKEDEIKYIQKFKNGIKRANQMANLKKRMETYFHIDDDGNKQITEYLDLYFNNHLAITAPPSLIDTLFSLVIKRADNDKFEFLLTPEELKQCMELKKGEGHLTIINKAKLLLAKKQNIAPSEIDEKSAWGGIDREIDDLEIEKKAPDYIKQAKWPISSKFKVAFLAIKFEDEELRKARWELLKKKWTTSDFNGVDEKDQYVIKEKMLEIITQEEKKGQKQEENLALREKSAHELATLFIKKIDNLLANNKETEKDLVEKMVKNFPRDYLYLLVWLANKYYDDMQWQARYKSMIEGIRNDIRSTKESKS